jgi:hypothetical protein
MRQLKGLFLHERENRKKESAVIENEEVSKSCFAESEEECEVAEKAGVSGLETLAGVGSHARGQDGRGR